MKGTLKPRYKVLWGNGQTTWESEGNIWDSEAFENYKTSNKKHMFVTLPFDVQTKTKLSNKSKQSFMKSYYLLEKGDMAELLYADDTLLLSTSA